MIPRSIEDVIATVEECRKHGTVGRLRLRDQPRRAACNVAVVIDFSKYLNHLLCADPEAKIARVDREYVTT